MRSPTRPVLPPADPVIDELVAAICLQLGYDPARPPINIDDHQAAEVLDTTPGTLCTWRSTGRYRIPFVKIGRNVRYPVRGLAAYMAARTYTQTPAAV